MKNKKVYLVDLSRQVAKNLDISYNDSKVICEEFLSVLQDNIYEFNEIVFSGHFVLKPIVRKGRKMVRYDGNIVYSENRPQVKFVPNREMWTELRKKFIERQKQEDNDKNK